MSYFKDYYKNSFRLQKVKNNSFLYELALIRGKNRGWYPNEWTIKDYEQYLFRNVAVKNPS